MKLLIFGVLGLVVGMGGGSAVSVMKAKKAFAAYEVAKAKLVADSIAAAAEHGSAPAHGEPAEHGDSAQASVARDTASASHEPKLAAGEHGGQEATSPPAKPDEHAASNAKVDHSAKQPSAPPRATKHTETVESKGVTPSSTPRVTLPPKPLSTQLGEPNERMSRIFAAMPPKEAAKVLEQLEDAEVHVIMSGLSEKQAAGVLQYLPPTRAAAISKLVLRRGIR